MTRFSTSLKLSFALFLGLVTGCVTQGAVEQNSEKGADSEPVSSEKVAPVQVAPEECVNYVQLKRDADYLCELPDGSTRPLKPGERRSTPLTRDEIEKVIRNNQEDTLTCFEASIPKDAKVEGKLFISFDIESDGKVANVRYNTERSTYKNTKLGACLVEKAKKWRFPVLRTDETLQINYPFQLISSEPEAPASQAP